uniref:TSA: Wollemia nobilis Ref_Wollemi_Transcript_14780_2565 transcribed RNA sequence n=1 Tax=Wollemia nobilis TaxID=56998 RepID=A0A0C9S6I8_9CONI
MKCNPNYFIFHFGLLIGMRFAFVVAEYRSSTCENATTYADGSTYSTNLNHVMDSLLSNVKQIGYNTSSYGQPPNKVYGLLQCFGNISADNCLSCSRQAKSLLLTICGNGIGGMLWMDYCFLRYENHSFISKLETQGNYLTNINEVSDNPQAFEETTTGLVSNLSSQASDPANKGFAAGSAKSTAATRVYCLVQCWRDISPKDCRSCLAKGFQNLENCCSKKEGAHAMLRSCTIRFETYAFFGEITEAPSPQGSTDPTPSGQTSNGTIPHAASKKDSSKTLPIILGVLGGVILVITILLFVMRRKMKSAIFGRPATVVTDREIRDNTPESEVLIQDQNFIFNLETLAEATGNFHDDNKLGEGGFGAVYKGKTKDGKEIAVKKLFARSGQGKKEFMNEMKLLANVQHRNLVKQLGCCAEGDERFIVYEYLPNKSLDTFLFDPEKREQLAWQKRYNIILGVARGLLYLHEDSQLRIIHRDIKANNILLDDKLNAKIADFGLARLFPEDKSHIQTRVAGTYGYMAPEYAMRGQLSVKADVYSFGVLLLEILSGRKNTDDNLPQQMQNLIEWVWRLYKGGDVLNMVDSVVIRACPQEQVLRCIHVGLLCVQADAALRPAMSNVIMMMSSNSVTLANPTKPAFVSSKESRGSNSNSSLGPDEFGKETPLQTSATSPSPSSGVPSVNETSITEVQPR